MGSLEKLGCLASEMESAALFIVASTLNVKAGSVFLTVANQEREKQNLENPVVHDTDSAIKTAIEALKILIANDKNRSTIMYNKKCNTLLRLVQVKTPKNSKIFLTKCQ